MGEEVEYHRAQEERRHKIRTDALRPVVRYGKVSSWLHTQTRGYAVIDGKSISAWLWRWLSPHTINLPALKGGPPDSLIEPMQMEAVQLPLSFRRRLTGRPS